jgi:putative hydrolase
VRISFEQLARVAELHVADVTGLRVSGSGSGISIEAVSRTAWTAKTIDDYRSLFEQLASSLSALIASQIDQLSEEEPPEELAALLPPGLGVDFAGILSAMSQFIGPLMTTSLAATTVGQLGRYAFGNYDLPIPRPPSDRICVIASHVDGFAADWSLPVDDVRLWWCIDEMAHHAVLSIPHVRARLTELLAIHASSFSADAEAIDDQLGDIDLDDEDSIANLQSLLASPDRLLSVMRSETQREVLPRIDAIASAIEGYADWVVDSVASRLLPSTTMLAEALRRRRVATDQARRFVERLFGLELTQPKIDAGRAFIAGIIERSGADALGNLWENAESLPTPSELEAPGLWLARVVGGDTDLAELSEAPTIPDYPDMGL